MIIQGYRGLPPTYAPDVGEVVNARRTTADKYVKAAVLKVRRVGPGMLKITLQWLEDDPAGGMTGPPIEAGAVGWITAVEGRPPLIEKISRGGPSA